MANETTSTTLTELVNPELISQMILMYGADASVVAPNCLFMNLQGRSTGVASVPQWLLDATADVSEGSAASNTELETSEVAAISAATIAIQRELTEFAAATNILGEDGIRQFIVEDGARLVALDLENDLVALFSGFSTAVGTTTVDFSVANAIEAVARVEGTKLARGGKVGILHPQQGLDLRTGVGATTGAIFGSQGNMMNSIMNQQEGDGFLGNLFGVNWWTSSLCDTANAGADVVGACFIDSRTNARYSSLAIAQLWAPRVRSLVLPDQIAEQIVISACHGVGRVSDFGVEITTDAP